MATYVAVIYQMKNLKLLFLGGTSRIDRNPQSMIEYMVVNNFLVAIGPS